MRFESVRELKLSLPAHLEKTFASKAAGKSTATAFASAAVADAASRQRRAPSYFLGVGVKSKKSYCLAVRLQDRALENSALVNEIRSRARGEVDVRYVGQIRARLWYRSKNRPLLIGTSTGFHLGTGFVMAGTLGCFVRKISSPDLYILSNNHVLADENRNPIGAVIVQPGELDGGSTVTDKVARLSKFVRLDPAATNLVDCAIAKLNTGITANTSKLKGLGTLAGVMTGGLGIHDVVHKIGRTTGLRHGRVTAVELDGVTVGYDIGTVSFDNQVEIEGSGTRAFSDAGDSGSLIVNDDFKAAVLLFAGGDHGGANGKGLTYGNPIHAVLSALKVKLVY